jgi:hypothetical protein
MPEDAAKIKERILSVLRIKGPGFPSPIASEIGLSILFTSAFLSELLSEKALKISSMHVGSSPIYFLAGQEPQLEYFAKRYLKSKEKDAFLLLQEKKILKDRDLEPAIRVALRAIKDFAIPLEKNNELFWKYYIAKDEEITVAEKVPEKEIIIEAKEEPIKEIIEIKDEVHKETKKIPKKKISEKKKSVPKKPASKTDDKFFNKVKEFLSNENIEIVNVQGFGKDELYLIIRENDQEKLLAAFNKKKISESEILKAYRKSQESNLNYSIISIGEPSKKLSNIIEASRNLNEIKKIN